MASQAHYGIAPSINLARTMFRTKYDLETTWLHGKLIPLDMIPVMPGSSFKVDITSYIRMSDPIVPLFGNIKVGIHAFFVPWRLIFDKTEEFFGENNTSKGPQTTIYKLPKALFNGVQPQSVADYLGKPLTSSYVDSDISETVSNYKAVCLKERAYMLIWNEWYRAQQVSNPFLINVGTADGSSNVLGTRDGVNVTTQMMPIEVAKQFDINTACTISPQYGEAVTVPFSQSELDVYFKSYEDEFSWDNPQDHSEGVHGPVFKSLSGAIRGLTAPGDTINQAIYENVENPITGTTGNTDVTALIDADSGSDPFDTGSALAYDPNGTLKVNLAQATLTSIRDLRFAFQLQRYYEALSFGSRYFEILRNIYGTTNPDARLQRPEHIGQIHFPIQIQQVLSTAGAESGVTSKLGQAGANSVTLNRSVLTSKGFTEFGYLCIMLDTKHDRVYSQGLRREDYVDDRFDIYSPFFDHIGDFAVLKKEVDLTNNTKESSDVFGYNEAWYNERYRESRVSGKLNPVGASPIAPYSLAEVFDNSPVLDESFMLEDRNNIARVLKTGTTGPDYLGNFHIELRMVKPMSAHSVPGLIDHVGRL